MGSNYNMRKFAPLESASASESSLELCKPILVPVVEERQTWWPRRLTFFSTDSIKRMAHREAWYGDSSNPFRKTHTGFGIQRERDIENQDGGDTTRVYSEPLPRPSGFSNDEARSPSVRQRPTDSEKIEMTSGNGEASRGEQSSEQTAVDATSVRKRGPPSVEQSARQRFILRFHKKRDPEMQVTPTGLTDSKSKKKFTLASQLRATLFNSWINILILAAPAGIALNYTHQTPWAIFIVNFIAIVPLAAMLSYATEELAIRVGETLGGLLNATFGYI
jgi:Ca2+:H+ antiporter